MSLVLKLLPPIFIDLYRKLAARNGKIGTYNYKIGKYRLGIPPNFALPRFQKTFRLYDRFLPVLAKNLSSEKSIIDVGANVGDTTISILQHCSNPILCFEPSEIFYRYLEDNLKLLDPKDAVRVKTHKALVGTGELKGQLVHDLAGTAKLKVSTTPSKATHVPLDNLIPAGLDIALIKVDTDGFDFDVLRSAERICSESEPILFWENDIAEDFQYQGFSDLYSWLTSKGYKYVYIFDNFGNLISEEFDFETLRNLNAYIYRMRKNDFTRTIYYTDILAATERNRAIAKRAIEEYKAKWIK